MYYLRRLFTVLFITLFIFSCKKTPTGSNQIVVIFSDANFETVIRETLGRPTGDITVSRQNKLERLV